VLVGRQTDGKRRQITRSGFRTKRAADAALRELLSRDDSELVEVHGLTFGAYLEGWLSSKRSLRATTLRGYASHLRLYLIPHLGGIKLVDLRPSHLDAMYDALLKEDVRSAATIRRVHATVRSALSAAVKRRLISWNPARHVELPTVAKPRTQVWTPEQLGHFLDDITEHRLYALFYLVAICGLRRGEVLGLSWSDVHLDEGTLDVRQQVVDTGHGLAFGPPKTRSGVRTVVFHADLAEALRQHGRAQSAEREAWGSAWVDSGLVFTRENGEVLRPEYVTHLFQRLTERANLPRIRFHDLRHTNASIALAAGLAMKTVSDRLGHSTTVITSDLYTHVVPLVARDASQRIADAIPRRKHPTDEPVTEQMSSECLASEAASGLQEME
jgi:integrase